MLATSRNAISMRRRSVCTFKDGDPFKVHIADTHRRIVGSGAAFWMNLQSNYDLALAEQELGERIIREVEAA